MIGGSILVLGGIAYYFLVYRKDGSKGGDETGEENVPSENNTQDVASNAPSSDCPIELNSVDKIKAFQDWMDTIGPWVKGFDGKYKKLNKGSGYGNCGPSTKAAWSYYGSQYKSGTKPASTDTQTDTSGLSSSILKDMDLILTYGAGAKSYTSYTKQVAKTYPQYIERWADAIRQRLSDGGNTGTTFIVGSKLYDSYFGENILNSSPKGKFATVTKPNAVIRELPNPSSASKPVNVNVVLDKVDGYKFNKSAKTLYLYIPGLSKFDSSKRWIAANYVTLS